MGDSQWAIEETQREHAGAVKSDKLPRQRQETEHCQIIGEINRTISEQEMYKEKEQISPHVVIIGIFQNVILRDFEHNLENYIRLPNV